MEKKILIQTGLSAYKERSSDTTVQRSEVEAIHKITFSAACACLGVKCVNIAILFVLGRTVLKKNKSTNSSVPGVLCIQMFFVSFPIFSLILHAQREPGCCLGLDLGRSVADDKTQSSSWRPSVSCSDYCLQRWKTLQLQQFHLNNIAICLQG